MLETEANRRPRTSGAAGLPSRGWLCLLCSLCAGFLLGAANPAPAEELKLQAQLVWGTDGGRPEGQDMRELDASIREKFMRHLRWKNYYVVRSAVADVSKGDLKRMELSKRCSVDVQREDKEIVIRIYSLRDGSEPRVLKTDRIPEERLRAGHAIVFGGDSKDNWEDAWFVVLTAVTEVR